MFSFSWPRALLLWRAQEGEEGGAPEDDTAAPASRVRERWVQDRLFEQAQGNAD